MKLPKLELKRYKFQYLWSYLDEPAKSVEAGFSLTEAAYDAAVVLLTKPYVKPRVIKRAHINQLLSVSPVFKETSIERLHNLQDQIKTHFRALEAQCVDKESYSTVIVPVLLDKILQSIWHNMIHFGKDHMNWNVDDLVEALDKEARCS